MSRKIKFVVVSSSSHEDNFSAQELLVHAPTASGWRSSRLCSYPQHITLQLVERTRVKKLQLLAHHYLIPAKVEFYIGDSPSDPRTSEFIGQLHRLGYVSLSDNEKTGFRTRELKSVHVDAIGTYLRIAFHKNYANRHNRYNQVALVAINVLGDPLGSSAFYTSPCHEQPIEHSLNGTRLEAALEASLAGKYEAASPFDDLAFDMYQDPELARVIRHLDQNKQDLLQQERFEQAKYLKQAIADLQKAGEHLARLDVETQCAMAKEEYDLAKKKKDEMDEYRRNVYKQLEVHNLLDMSMFSSAPYDESPIPALQRNEQPVAAVLSPFLPDVQSDQSEAGQEPPPLSEKAKKEAALPIEVFGESLVASAYSTSWSHREDALLAVHKKLSEVPSTIPKEELRGMIRASVFLVRRALVEKVLPVFQASLKLLLFMLSQLIPGLGRGEVTYCLEKIWPNLLSSTGNSISRFRISGTACIQEIAVLKEVRALQFIPVELVKPFESKCPARLAQSRAEMLQSLLVELGTERSGFTLDNVMMFCMAALEHEKSTVQELAAQIILSVYKIHRSAVLSYLPPRNGARKNFLYKTIFDGFAKIDEQLVETPGVQMENEEIDSLQEQLASLKDFTEKDQEQIAKKEVDKGSQKAAKQSTSVLKLPQKKPTTTIEVQQSLTYLDNLCIFCGKTDDSFTDDGLDLHYWKHCPMLRLCDECRQVVEIASFTEHLLNECQNKSKFSQCQRCSEAVLTEEMSRHVQSKTCKPSVPGKPSSHCPLCHANFSLGEQAWKAHLTGREGCKQNSRRTAVSQRTQPAQGRAVTKPTQTSSVGTRGRGGRTPSLAPPARGHTPAKR
nr:centrosomal protein of 104 kDa-like [Nerophis lumbriciformis]